MKKILGNIAYFALLPILIILGIVWWRGDTAFMLRNIRMGLTGKDYR